MAKKINDLCGEWEFYYAFLALATEM
jgi:hypothetical protein